MMICAVKARLTDQSGYAACRALSNGVKKLIIQPTHLDVYKRQQHFHEHRRNDKSGLSDGVS